MTRPRTLDSAFLHTTLQSADADIRLRHTLAARVGFSLWLGPSQVPTATHKAGVYLKGHVPAGTVVALFPGAAYNADMRLRAVDSGNLRNPRLPRRLLRRYDDCDLHVDSPEAAAVASRNPYAIAQHIRVPPPASGLTPNVMRLQYDFTAPPGGDSPASAAVALFARRDRANAADAGVDSVLPFPAHLRQYVPNVWGADVSAGQSLFGMLEQAIWCKGIVAIALRPLWDEELLMGPAGPTLSAAHAAQRAQAALPAGSGSGGQAALPPGQAKLQ